MTWRVFWSDGGTLTWISCCWVSPDVRRLGELDWTLRVDNSGVGHRVIDRSTGRFSNGPPRDPASIVARRGRPLSALLPNRGSGVGVDLVRG